MARYWELDALRGIAVLCMIIYHTAYDLHMFFGAPLHIFSSGWNVFGTCIAAIFLILTGTTLGLNKHKTFRYFFFRGSKIFLWGLLITLVTWLLLPSGTILFGILHLIGVSAVLAYPFIKHRWLALWSGIVCLLLGFVVAPLSAPTWWLLPLGIEPLGFFSIDYYPILPWFGFVLIGIFFANTVYTNRKATVHPCAMSARSASWIGKHSLAIYLLHQPILFGSIFVATKLL